MFHRLFCLESFYSSSLSFGSERTIFIVSSETVIMRSSRFFLSHMEEYCAERGILLYLTEDTSIHTLQGLTRI